MKTTKNTGQQKEPATIIAQVNGKIIFMNHEAKRSMPSLNMGDSISRVIDIDYVNKMTLYNTRLDVLVPKNCNFEKAVVKILGTGITKTVEISFFNSEGYEEQEQINDRKIFATFSEVVGKEVVGRVRLGDFASQIVTCLKNDLRFAYRKFEILNYCDSEELYANFAHLSVITVATVIALNEIEYKKPIKIEVDRIDGKFILDISVSANTFIDKEGMYALCQTYPHIAMRLMYITSLCDCDGISYEMKIKPNAVSIRYVINEMINSTGKFSAAVFSSSLLDITAYILDVFSTKGHDSLTVQ